MREIKFKAKRKDHNDWVYGSLLILENGYYIVPKGTYYNEIDIMKDCVVNAIWEEQDFFEVIPKTLCQYTGLKDKNGVEIYENDVIRLDDDHRRMISAADAEKEEDLVRKDCLVGFKDGSFMFCRNRYIIDDFDSYLWLTNSHCQVTRNLYDKEVE